MNQCLDYMKRVVPCGIEQPVPLPEPFAGEWWVLLAAMATVLLVRAWRRTAR